MSKSWISHGWLIGVYVLCAGGINAGQELKLWYEQLAKQWIEALPIGNGGFGALVFGGTAKGQKYQEEKEEIESRLTKKAQKKEKR